MYKLIRNSAKPYPFHFKPFSTTITTIQSTTTTIQPTTTTITQQQENDVISTREYKENVLKLRIPETKFNYRFSNRSEVEYVEQINQMIRELNDKSEQRMAVIENAVDLSKELNIGHFMNKVLKDIYNRQHILQGYKVNYELQFMNKQNLQRQSNKQEQQQEVDEIMDQKVKEYVNQLNRWGIYNTYQPKQQQLVHKHTQFIETFIQLYQQNQIQVRKKSVLWNISQQKEVSLQSIEQKSQVRDGYFMTVQIVNNSRNKELLDELSNFDIDVDKLHLVVLVDESVKLLNSVGIKVSLATNYVVVYYEQRYLVMSSQFYRRNYKYMKESYEVYRTVGEKLLGVDIVNNFNIYQNIVQQHEQQMQEYSGYQVYEDNYLKLCQSRGSGLELVCPVYEIADKQIQEQNRELENSRYVNIDQKGGLLVDPDYQCYSYFCDLGIDQKDSIKNNAKQYLKDNGLLFGDQEEQLEVQVIYDKSTNEQIYFRNMDQFFIVLSQKQKQQVQQIYTVLDQKVVQNQEDENTEYLSLTELIDREEIKLQISRLDEKGFQLPVIYDRRKKEYILNALIMKRILKFVKEGQQIDDIGIDKLLNRKQLKQIENYELGQLSFNESFINSINFVQCVLETQHEQLESQIQLIEGVDQIQKKQQFNLVMSYILLDENQMQNLIRTIKIVRNHILLYFEDKKISSNRYIDINRVIDGNLTLSDKKQFGLGVDVMRLYIASIDDRNQQTEYANIDQKDLIQVNKEYKLIRKVYWQMFRLVNIIDQSQQQQQQYEVQESIRTQIKSFEFINQYIYDNLMFLVYNCEQEYQNYNTQNVYRYLMDFLKNYVSDIYIEYVQDLVVNQNKQQVVQEARIVLEQIINVCLIIMAPIVPFSSQNMYLNSLQLNGNRIQNQSMSVFMNRWPSLDHSFLVQRLTNFPIYDLIMTLRITIIKRILKNKVIQSFIQGKKNEKSTYLQKIKQLDLELILDDSQLEFDGEEIHDIQYIQNNHPESKKMVELYQRFQLLSKIQHYLSYFLNFNSISVRLKSQSNLDSRKHVLTVKQKIKVNQSVYKVLDIQQTKEVDKIELELKIYKNFNLQCIRCKKYKVDRINAICNGCLEYLEEYENIRIGQQL